ncbi:putative ribonuclease II-like protein [Leishmania infantum JPCM5]|uniref:DIS3-like_exonuclease_-_putative n=2 Tax=Leishmania infantum TaxID=5671 RepID=A0A6L0XJP2_LEIIN|nr:putative ribonuclease II-like protein [Leishmania infantum JPCM5]CAC9501759.1 DIS3-like_exonuclease_-_putative [Leishmania infantum]CAM69257.1 putative ribonuclease II-like protein [Leishmania infantum JPCM5]SUZ43192.1 DIS3-like_exonuclease_-_putative [Leishmania infantum]|eukprot:XP_001470065.1 putative ribonuclease II-like protein [Leishmania infantum JPCM5]
MTVITCAYALGSDPDLEKRVKEGTVVIGRVNVFRNYNTNLSFVRSSRLPCDVVLNSAELRGPALHSDVVAVALLPLAQWQPAPNAASAVPASSDSNTDDEETENGPRVMPSTLPDGRHIAQLIAPETTEELIQNASAEVSLAAQMGAPFSYEWPPEKRPLGRVIRILKRCLPRLHVARIADNQVHPGEGLQEKYYYRFRPFNQLYPQLTVQGCDIMAAYHANISTSLFSLALEHGENGEILTTPRVPNALLCKVHSFLGDASTMAVASHAICTSCNVSNEPFSEEAEACVLKDFTIPSPAELADMGRRDLRDSEFVLTIDPATARDLDDALSIKPRKDGGYHVGVHIADVSHFVLPRTALDEEAQRRSNSTYLVDRVIPMLPSRLSEEYCSLNPGEDKFAFSGLFEFDRDGHLISEAATGEKCEWFGQSVIRSRCRLAYEQAQQILDGDDTVVLDVAQAASDLGIGEEAARKKVKQSVTNLFALASKLRQQSLRDGRVVIGNTRLAFRFDRNEVNSPPTSFFVQEQIQANWLVEEFMLLANQRVAQKIVQYIPYGALLRRHKPPQPQKMRRLRTALSHRGLPTGGSSGQELQRMIDTIKKDHRGDFHTVCELLKYSLMAAEYIANDPTEKDIRSHFAVAAPWYTHFTSPIRRYCDLMVHRQLRVALELERCMEEAQMEMPNAPHPALETRPVDCIFDPTRAVDVHKLKTRELFYPLSALEHIVTHANECRLNSRSAGDMSLEYSLCLYLLALQKRAKEDPTLPQQLYTTVTIVKITEGSFLLYSAELASVVEIGFNDIHQRFRYQGLLVTGDLDAKSAAQETRADTRAAAERASDAKAKAHARKKGGKSDMPRRGAADGGQGQHHFSGRVNTVAAQFSWGSHPETGEEVTEVFDLFTEFVALLEVTAKQGRLSLGMQLLQPWEREAARRVCPKVPTSLVEEQ